MQNPRHLHNFRSANVLVLLETIHFYDLKDINLNMEATKRHFLRNETNYSCNHRSM